MGQALQGAQHHRGRYRHRPCLTLAAAAQHLFLLLLLLLLLLLVLMVQVLLLQCCRCEVCCCLKPRRATAVESDQYCCEHQGFLQ
jgi:hypothetical protein